MSVRKQKKNFTLKFFSRKFIVFLTATIFLGIAFAMKDGSIIGQILNWWGTIAVLYIGGNFAKGYLPNINGEKSE